MTTTIIGAGPIGLYVSAKLAKAGYNVNVIEEHSKIGLPIQCTGIVTKEIEKIIKLKKKFVVNKISQAKIYSKNESITIPVNDIILNREKFDSHLGDLAIKEGVKVEFNKRINTQDVKQLLNAKYNNNINYNKNNNNYNYNNNNYNYNNNNYNYNNNNYNYNNKNNNNNKNYKNIIIGADGPNSIIRKYMNPKILLDYYIGKQATVKGSFEKNTFSIFLGSVAPNFFGWIVPENEESARVGIATQGNTSLIFKRFLTQQKIKLNQITEYQAGLIPLYNNKLKTQLISKNSNMFIVGDAATQIKSSTGGGLVPGLLAGQTLVNSIVKSSNYEKGWKQKIGHELFSHNMIRKTLNKFTDKDYDQLLQMLKHKNVRSTFKQESRDKGLNLAIKLLIKQPRLLYFLKKIL